jgi:AraC family transcriptional regulator
MTIAVHIVQFAQTKVACIEHRGSPTEEYATTARLIAWRVRNRLPPSRHATYGLHYTDYRTIEPSLHRVDFCVATDEEIAPNAEGVVAKTIPACRCAVVRHHGSGKNNLSAFHLWDRWLPASGEQPSGLPMIFHYVNVGPDVQASDMVIDVYLPLRD